MHEPGALNSPYPSLPTFPAVFRDGSFPRSELAERKTGIALFESGLLLTVGLRWALACSSFPQTPFFALKPAVT